MAFKNQSAIRPISVLLFIFLNFFVLSGCSIENPSSSDEPIKIQKVFRDRIEAAGFPVKMAIGEEAVLASELIPLFYKQRDFEPAWTREGVLLPQAEVLIQNLKRADTEGLRPADYHSAKIENLVKNLKKLNRRNKKSTTLMLSDLDFLLTDAFLSYATHLVRGKVDPDTLEVAWNGSCVDEDLVHTLENALASNKVGEALDKFTPHHSFYLNLKKTLAFYRKLAAKDNWRPLPDLSQLRKGDKGKQVRALSERLFILGDIPKEKIERKKVFDDTLEEALRHFQKRHGLEVTAIVDPPTLAALNLTPAERIREIELNLERWRWLPHDLGQRYIYVNIANFHLDVFENGEKVMSMKIVAGTQTWQSPDFSSQMTYLVINPYWNAPSSVLLKELINYIRQDQNYLTSNKMVLLQGRGFGEKEIDPKTINWSEVNEKNLNFRLRQDPGPLNVLGRILFAFPNKYDVFLHDTPYQEDFSKATRAFSHGCIRAEKPVELATYVLRDMPGWDMQKILAAIDENCEQIVKLNGPINVHFLYCTVWQDEDGTLQFRADIYERDKRLAAALNQKPPTLRLH
jgi:murein L,D-transpeptidase YcbB/YkuD